MQAARNADSVNRDRRADACGGRTDGELNEDPKPHPSHIQVPILILIKTFVGTSEYTAPNYGNGYGKSNEAESARQDYFLSEADTNVP